MKRSRALLGRRGNRVFPGESKRRLAAARRAFDAACRVLSSYEGVVGVGVGLKERCGEGTGRVAFIATVQRKGGQAKEQTLPHELLGFPVDVQVEPELPRLKTVAGGQRVQRPGRPPPGRVGCLVRDADGRVYVLTALHVVAQETGDDNFEWDQPRHFDVAVDQGDGLKVVGRLRAGKFNSRWDIACIELDDGTLWQAGLAGIGTELVEPADPEALAASAGIALAPSGAAVSGTFVQYPRAGDFATDAGVRHFTHLMQFRVVTPHGIPDGWSGSVLYDAVTNEPLALLSFGSDSSDHHGRATAYGFPLLRAYQKWNLRPA